MTNAASALLAFSNHPLVVVLVSAVIGSILIPRLNARISRDARKAEMKLEHARKAVSAGTDVDRTFNAVVGAFENFVKDEALEDGTLNSAAKDGLKSRVYQLYAEFDKNAWWWHWQFLEDVRLLKLVNPDGDASIDRACHDYQTNLIQSVDELNRLWRSILRVEQPIVKDIPIAEVSSQLRECRSKRHATLLQMVSPLIS